MDPQEPAAGDRAERPLTSWKEIAAVFGRDVRTVQRWEKEEGLPIHRHPHSRRSSVYATRHELESWWRARAATGQQPDATPVSSEIRRWGTRAAIGALVAISVATPSGVIGREPARAPIVPIAADASTTAAAAVGDADGRGGVDVLFAPNGASSVTLTLGDSADDSGAGGRRVVIELPARTTTGPAQLIDADADGIDDVVLLAQLQEPESFHGASSFFMVRGRPDWPDRLRLPDAADVEFVLPVNNEANLTWCGRQSESADLNRDGVADLFFGGVDFIADGRASAGGVFVVYGRTQWPRRVDLLQDADVTLIGGRMGEGLGGECAVGDVNHDGRPDLLVHAMEATLWNLLGGRGRIYAVLGRDEWPRKVDMATSADLTIVGRGGDASKAANVSARVADVTGDGVDDIVIGWPHGTGAPDDRGAITIWRGGSGLGGQKTADQADVTIRGQSARALLGSAVATRDLDGDGVQDIVTSEAGTGRLWLLYGRPDWPAAQSIRAAGAFALADEAPIWDANGIQSRSGAGGRPDLYVMLRRPANSGVRLSRLEVGRPLTVDVRPGWTPNVVLQPGPVVIAVGAAAGDEVALESVRVNGQAPDRTTSDADRRGGLAYFDTSNLQLSPTQSRIAVSARSRAGWPLFGSDEVRVVRR